MTTLAATPLESTRIIKDVVDMHTASIGASVKEIAIDAGVKFNFMTILQCQRNCRPIRCQQYLR